MSAETVDELVTRMQAERARADRAEAELSSLRAKLAETEGTANLAIASAQREMARADALAARLAETERERDEARRWVTDFQAKIAAAKHDGGAKCSYCHGIGACPRCWGRAGIEQLTTLIADAERDRGEAESRWTQLSDYLAETEKQRDGLKVVVDEIPAMLGRIASKLDLPVSQVDEMSGWVMREARAALASLNPESKGTDHA